jgi:hypothetical protein
MTPLLYEISNKVVANIDMLRSFAPNTILGMRLRSLIVSIDYSWLPDQNGAARTKIDSSRPRARVMLTGASLGAQSQRCELQDENSSTNKQTNKQTTHHTEGKGENTEE